MCKRSCSSDCTHGIGARALCFLTEHDLERHHIEESFVLASLQVESSNCVQLNIAAVARAIVEDCVSVHGHMPREQILVMACRGTQL